MLLKDRHFLLLCLSSLLFFMSFNMIIPALPDVLRAMDGEKYQGLIISLFTVTAALSRPFSGKLADFIGRKPIMIFGALICFICSALYPFLTSIFGFFLLRLIHGFSTGFTPTGNTAYIADIIPHDRRAEAMGYLGFFSSCGMALGPFLGGLVMTHISLNFMFYFSALCGFISIIIVYNMKETLIERYAFKMDHLRIKKHEWIQKAIIPAGITILLIDFSFGVNLTFMPDFTQSLGIENKGIYFLYYTISTIFIRILSGKLSDKMGRIKMIKIAVLLQFISVLSFYFVSSHLQFFFSCCLFGIALGFATPSLFAWTIDLSPSEGRARSLATLYIFMEAGIGLGAFCSGIFFRYFNQINELFILTSVFSLLAFFYLNNIERKLERIS